MTATWVLAGATCLLALTSLVAVATWREGRRRAAQEQDRVRAAEQQQQTLDAARKEFATKEDIGGLKSTLGGLGILAGVIAGLAAWDKISGSSKDD